MAHIDSMKNSKYLTQFDVDPPRTFTMWKCQQEDVSMQDKPTDMKWCLHFHDEDVKPLVLNQINRESIAEVTGEFDTDDWDGKKITLYKDPNIRFGNEKKGGIRVKLLSQTFKEAANEHDAQPVGDDGAPF